MMCILHIDMDDILVSPILQLVSLSMRHDTEKFCKYSLGMSIEIDLLQEL